MSSDFKNIKH